MQTRFSFFIFLFTVLYLITGCSTIKYIPVNTTVVTKDTVTVTLRDTLVTFKTDTLRAEIKDIAANTDTVSVLSNDFAASTAIYSNHTLHHTLITYPHPIKITVPEVNRISFRQTVKEIPVEVIKEKKVIPDWVWWSVGVNVLVILFIILKITLKLHT